MGGEQSTVPQDISDRIESDLSRNNISIRTYGVVFKMLLRRLTLRDALSLSATCWELRFMVIREKRLFSILNCSKVNEAKFESFFTFLPLVADSVTEMTCRYITEYTASSQLESLPTMPHLKLLDLSYSEHLTSDHLRHIAKRTPIVMNLILKQCQSLDNSALHVISTFWSDLILLSLEGCAAINDTNGDLLRFHRLMNSLQNYNIDDVGCFMFG